MRNIESLNDDEILAIEARMRPGAFSQVGFLQPEQSLVSLLNDDAALLDKHGVSCEQIADRIETLVGKAHRLESLARRRGQFLYSVDVAHFRITLEATLGFQGCPFSEDEYEGCGKGSRDYKITNLQSGESIKIAELAIHLIRDHGFFEGVSEYRVEPEAVIKALEIESGQSYRPFFAYEEVWSVDSYESRFFNYGRFLPMMHAFAGASRLKNLPKGLRAWSRGDELLLASKKEVRLDEALKIDDAWVEVGKIRGVYRLSRKRIRFIEAQTNLRAQK